MPSNTQASDNFVGRGPSSSRPAPLSSVGMHQPSVAESMRLASLRRSTPDSEAVLSSDDEPDMIKSTHSANSKTGRHPTSADGSASWLHEIQSGPPRRLSIATSTSNISQPLTPLEQTSEHSAWPFQNPLSRISSHPVNSTWQSTSPWAQSPSKPIHDDKLPAFGRAENAVAGPFQIQPTSKAARSQSYSVGQQEGELGANPRMYATTLERQRMTPAGPLPHRPSRPSMLSEVFQNRHSGTDSASFESGSYDVESLTSPSSTDPRRDQPLVHQMNPLLRHATRSRPMHGYGASLSEMRRGDILSNDPIDSEQVIDDDGDIFNSSGLSRRFSELGGLGANHNVSRRNQWQSSLGFGTLPDIPQSRRHSMAEIPTRRNSLINDHSIDRAIDQTSEEEASNFVHSQVATTDTEIYQQDQQNRNWAAAYFSGVGPAMRSRLESAVSSGPPHSPNSGYPTGQSSTSFQRPSHDTPLYLVSFKCARAEVYYVAPNTGLEVNEGDLVIVEADRGHDLGTVLNARIDWNQAREMKAKANEEHYRWLMMFSRHNQSSDGLAAGGPGGMMAGNAPDRASAMGRNGFGAQMGDSAGREVDLKPKMIKRLAQPNEIAVLRDKEGNEAKAKRICQQKVGEMNIDMEILDAEFQTDWKKLTFFYYAHSYVNFNVLVTDLFKIYKTRIWMSAVNPASLNTTPVPPPRGLGPGAVSARDSNRGAHTGSAPYGGNGHSPYTPESMASPQMFGQSNNYYQYPSEAGPSLAHGHPTPQSTFEANQYHAQQQIPNPFATSYHGYNWNGLPQPNALNLGSPFANPWGSPFASGAGFSNGRQPQNPGRSYDNPLAAGGAMPFQGKRNP